MVTHLSTNPACHRVTLLMRQSATNVTLDKSDMIEYLLLIAGDEMSRRCYFGQFKCATHGCIDSFQLCNGVNDCEDGSDEIGCGL